MNALNYIINLQNGNFGRGMEQAQSQVQKLDNLVAKVSATIGTAFAFDRALQLTEEVTEIKAKFEAYDNVIKFASNGVQEYDKNTQFLKTTIKELKLPLQETTDSFSQWLGSIKSTNLEGEMGRKIFLGVSTAATTLHLSSDKVSRTFNALSQMMGKGKVQAEELRGQLGESLPGAFTLAAKAMGITTAQLNKMLDDGKVLPQELLPKLADELLKTFGPGVQNAVGSLQSKINENTNAILQQKIALGEELAPAHLAWLNLQLKGYQILSATLHFYKEHETLINSLAVGLAVATGAYYAVMLATKAYTAWQAISYTWGILQLGMAEANTLGLTGWAAAQWALNIAMGANPVGAIILGIIALGAALIYAYNKSENFRATLAGVWAMLKSVAEMIGRVIALPFQILLDPKGAIESIGKIKDLALNMGSAYTDGRAASFSESEKAAKADKTKEGVPSGLQDFINGKGSAKLPAGSGTAGAGKPETTSGSGGSSVRNVSIHIGVIKTADKLTIETTNIQNTSFSELEQIITDSLVRAAHDGEVIIASN
jgi:tape measure domain-containing protein